jgi:hypothetical protein
MADVPAEISQVAATSRMGRLIDARQAPTPSKSFLLNMVGAIAGIGGAYALGWVAYFIKINGMGDVAREFALIALLGFIFGIWFALCAIRSLFGGHRSAYLYENGIIWRRNRKIESVPWPRMKELVRWRMGGDTWITGTVLYYVLVTVDGRRLQIDKLDTDLKETFSLRLQDYILRRGGRVVDGGSYVQLGKPILPISLQFMLPLFLLCSAALGWVLFKIGLPEGALMWLATLPIGLAVSAIELRTGRPFGTTSAAMNAPFGGPYTAIGGMLFAGSVGMAYGALYGWLTFGLVVVIAVVAIKWIKARLPLYRAGH